MSLKSLGVVCEWVVYCFEVFDEELEMCNVLGRRIQVPGLLGGKMAVHGNNIAFDTLQRRDVMGKVIVGQLTWK